jgi:hypothetical protein
MCRIPLGLTVPRRVGSAGSHWVRSFCACGKCGILVVAACLRVREVRDPTGFGAIVLGRKCGIPLGVGLSRMRERAARRVASDLGGADGVKAWEMGAIGQVC